MGSILTNGVFLPAEGERNCYEGLAANWTALDRLIGGYNAHIGNATIHVTAEDKATWNGKADASALTAHTGNTTIHVTSADKQAWNGKADASALTAHTGDTTIHVTAEDKAKWDAVTSKANDSDVVHKSGNETINGNKTFSSINGVEPSSLGMPDLDNGIDISSYLDTSQSSQNYYTPPVNGWISIKGRSGSTSGIVIIQDGMAQMGYSLIDFNSSNRVSFCSLPVKGGVQVEIWLKGVTRLDSAKFYPRLGNV